MNQLLVNPQPHHQWSKAIQKSEGELIEPIHAFPLRSTKGAATCAPACIAEPLLSRRTRETKQTLAAMRCIALNLLRATRNKVTTGILVPFGKKRAEIPKRFRVSPFSNRVVTHQLKQLEEAGLVRIRKGFKSKGHLSGIPSLVLPTAQCIELLQPESNFSAVDISQVADPIILRHSPSDYVLYEDNELTQIMRSDIQQHNELRRSVTWCYQSDSTGTQTLLPIDVTCRRIFKNDWDAGGRFYCDAQNLSQAQRRTIIINGEPCVELDYKSLHPRLMYNRIGLPAPVDCYDIDGLDRPTAKKLGLIATSTSSRTQAIRSIAFHLNMSREDADRALSLFESRHSDISAQFYVEQWKSLQHQDSLIANGVLNTMTNLGIPTLPVHDSFVVPVSSASVLCDAMNDEYLKATSFKPVLSQNI